MLLRLQTEHSILKNRYTMASLKEQTRPTTQASKPPRIEVDEELMRRMIAGGSFMDSPAVIPI